VNEQIREQLIGYVLGSLDAQEQSFVERQLGADPAWRRELEIVQKTLEPLAEAYHEYEPPNELAERACRFVAEESGRLKVERPCPRIRHGDGGFDESRRWRLADWVVLAGICLAAVSLFFPALLNSRISARIIACQDNLRELGLALSRFSETTRERYLPPVATEGNRAFAGFYAPVLQDAGLLRDSQRVICPESKLLRELRQFRIPSTLEIDSAVGDQILLMQRFAGGAYAYSLSFVSKGEYQRPRNLGRTYFVVMADAPSLDSGGVAVHGKGLNVLYEDSHVRYVCDWLNDRSVMRDNPFCNRIGRMEAGRDIDDAVVAPSHFPPLLKNTAGKP
jgi:hypothetical protein